MCVYSCSLSGGMFFGQFFGICRRTWLFAGRELYAKSLHNTNLLSQEAHSVFMRHMHHIEVPQLYSVLLNAEKKVAKMGQKQHYHYPCLHIVLHR